MQQLWKNWWFLIVLVGVLTGGLGGGLAGPAAVAEGFLAIVQPSVTTAIVLFLMAYSLDSSRLHDSLCRPAAAVWGTVVNLGLLPVVAYLSAFGVPRADLALGLILTAVAPCTLATASVFTRRAGGNDAVSLLVTLVTNVACVAVTPIWLHLLISRHAEFDTAGIVRQLLICVLAPTLLGQLCLWPRFGRQLADRYRAQIGMAAQGIVLLLVAVAAVSAGLVLRRQSIWPTGLDFLATLAACVFVHVTGLAAGWWGGRLWALTPEDRIATAIAASQKTLPVSLLIAMNPTVVPADAPFVAFPLLIYHASQLLIDTLIADLWRTRSSTEAQGWPSLGPISFLHKGTQETRENRTQG